MATNSSALIVPPRPAAPTTASVATNDIRPIKPPVPISNPWAWFWWALVLSLVAAALLAAMFWRKRKRAMPPPVPFIPPHVRAKQKLAEALLHISDPRIFCIEVSDAVRWYLEDRFDFRAPERTTEEFLVELQGTPRLSSTQKTSLGVFLESCDLVKFAKYEPTEQALRELHESACRLVDETRFEPVTTTPAAAGPPPPPVPMSTGGVPQ
jgi:hypothetical protein